MKNFSLLLCACLVTIMSCKRIDDNMPNPTASNQKILVEKINPAPIPLGDPMSKAELDKKVIGILQDRHEFRWEWVDLHTLWSATQYGNHAVSIGYKPAGISDIENIIQDINLQSPEWKAVHDAIIKLVVDELSTQTGTEVNLKDILVEDDATLPILTFTLTDRTVITKLYNLQNVRYVEPLDYWYENDRSASGCSGSTEPLNALDWTTTDPGCVLPWNYTNINVSTAWTTAQGQGIKIGVIDAGISNTQTLLGNQFASGYSNNNRTITTDYTYGTSAYTSCKHGTSMCGLAAGPRNSFGATSGIAYKSNLHFIRACNDVMLDESNEKLGVKNALVKMGNIADLKVISMSVGTPFSSSVLYDGVTYAYSKGKMLFAAAGTSYDWTSWWGVIYPANYSQCNAITGVKENGSTCAVCHDGSQVDFTIPMERNANSNRNSLSLDASGYNYTYIGGSSCATAMSAGVAALVWSVNPNLTRSQVYTCMRNTAQFYPNPNSNLGYGNINASAAATMALTQ